MENYFHEIDELRAEALEGRLDRRSVLKRGIALGLSAPIIAGLLAACGGSEKATSTPAAAATSPSGGGEATKPAATAPSGGSEATKPVEASPTTGGGSGEATEPGHGRGKADLLRILYWQAPTILNPHFSQGTKDSAASSLILEPLIDVDIKGNLIPVLAAEIPSLENGGVSKDGLSVTYKLKKDVTWSDGEPFTANDVKFTWQFTTDETAATTTIAKYIDIKDIEVVDDHTVTIHFKNPTPGWYSPFATGFGGQILPEHILKDFMGANARNAAFNLAPVGTGPYKLTEFKPGDVMMCEINDKYREADKPYFSKVEFKGGGDATAAARAALQSGETDWGWNLQVEKSVLVPMAESSTVGDLLNTPSVNVERLIVNFADPNKEVDGARSEPSTQHPFLSDKSVREALMLASDRQTVADQLYGPAGKATPNILVAPEKFASQNTSFEFNLDKAKQTLDAAGWTGSPRAKGDVEIKILYQTTINPLRQKTQEIIKQGWESIGVPTELKSIDAGVYFSSDAGNPDTAAHLYADIEMYTSGPSSPYPIDYMTNWKSVNPAVDIAQKSNQWAGGNIHRWVNEDFNKLYTQAVTELDEAKQVKLFWGMNDLVVNEIVVVPLVHRADVTANSKKLKGFKPSPWTPDVHDIANWYFEG
ncbi:MAG TPA: peptide ABC transporter substrate-binding protein [Thermomicrobiales bacterium]|nr:peptide ABC transporter substrate-binding protein [Thermomicrobiales bacterium]